MSDLPFEKGAAAKVAARLNAAKAELGHPYDGRWRWWLKRRHSAKVSNILRQTTPATVTRYEAAKQRVTDTSRKVRRTLRRHVFWLWVQIVFASLWAFVWRARIVLMILAFIASIGFIVYHYGPAFIRFLSELLVEDAPAYQVTPSSQASPAPQTSAPNSRPTNGTNVPSKGPR